MNKYNTHFPDDATLESLTADREAMLRENLGNVGKSPFIEPVSVLTSPSLFILLTKLSAFFHRLRLQYLRWGLFLRQLQVSLRKRQHTSCDNADRSHSLIILDAGIVKIGNRVLFGPNVSIFPATHETDVQSRRDGVEYAKPVSIGSDCWIGGNVTIMPGVTIGKGCTIGAGSVVTKDIPDFSVAIGSPARVVKKVDAVPDL